MSAKSFIRANTVRKHLEDQKITYSYTTASGVCFESIQKVEGKWDEVVHVAVFETNGIDDKVLPLTELGDLFVSMFV